METQQNKIIMGDVALAAQSIADGEAMAVIIDPPYGYAETKKMKIEGVEVPKWDTLVNAERAIKAALAATARILHDDGLVFVFAPYELIGTFEQVIKDNELIVGGVAVWDKTFSRPRFKGIQQQAEFVIWAHKLGAKPRDKSKGVVSGVFRQHNIQKDKWHPTPKPVNVMQWLLSAAHDGLVVDMFAGTCASAHAAHSLGRPFVMIERDIGYVKKASEALSFASILHCVETAKAICNCQVGV